MNWPTSLRQHEKDALILESFARPNCGTALHFDGTQTTMHCPGCGGSIIVPDRLRSSTATSDPLVPDPSLSEVADLLRLGQRVHVTILYREMPGPACKQHNCRSTALWRVNHRADPID